VRIALYFLFGHLPKEKDVMNKTHTFAIATWISMLIMGCFFLYGCADDEEDGVTAADEYYYPQIQNLLFYGTREISLEITPNVSNPSFAWDATGLKYVVVSIFNSKIDLKDDRIANPEDAVWTWNNGLGKGREGNVSFSDGRNVVNGEIQKTGLPSPLAPRTYYIAAWGYDKYYNLTHSSKEYQYEYYPQ